jgi:AcrR family transcriptional regulator
MVRKRKLIVAAHRAKAARRRRAPEVARQEILDAAERVFIEFQPDQVGLKEVAREAGVSHALITHYFGTYSGLVEATLERRVRALRETLIDRLRESGALSRPAELLGILFRTLEDPVHLRLMLWLVASERPTSANAFALHERGIQVVAHQVADAISDRPTRDMIETLELAMMTAVAAAFGWAASKHALSGAIGRGSSRELDLKVQNTLAGMLQSYLREQFGPLVTLPASRE